MAPAKLDRTLIDRNITTQPQRAKSKSRSLRLPFGSGGGGRQPSERHHGTLSRAKAQTVSVFHWGFARVSSRLIGFGRQGLGGFSWGLGYFKQLGMSDKTMLIKQGGKKVSYIKEHTGKGRGQSPMCKFLVGKRVTCFLIANQGLFYGMIFYKHQPCGSSILVSLFTSLLICFCPSCRRALFLLSTPLFPLHSIRRKLDFSGCATNLQR